MASAIAKKIGVVFISMLTIALAACRANEQPLTIGIVNFLPAMQGVIDGFQEGMVELGYIEGETVVYRYDGPVPDFEELDGMAQEHVEMGVDLILSLSTPATLAAQKATAASETPVVFVPVTDPEGNNIVDSLSMPGGNLTGVTNGGSDARRLELLLQLAPGVQNVFIPYNARDGSALSALAPVQETAALLDVNLLLHEIETAEDVSWVLDNIPAEADAIFLLPDTLTVSRTAAFGQTATANRLPLSGPTRAQFDEGVLFVYGIDFFAVGKQAARLADQILGRGQVPADLPVETAEFFLDINTCTADKIGLEIPDIILDQTHQIQREC